jgi:hypothetical protein
MVEAKYFLKMNNASQKYLNKLVCFRGFHLKYNFQHAFDDNLSVTHVFIKQIFRAVVLLHPPSPSPSQGSAWGGVIVALFSHKQWLMLWL